MVNIIRLCVRRMVLHHDMFQYRDEVIKIHAFMRTPAFAVHRKPEPLVEMIPADFRKVIPILAENGLHEFARILHRRKVAVAETLVYLYV